MTPTFSPEFVTTILNISLGFLTVAGILLALLVNKIGTPEGKSILKLGSLAKWLGVSLTAGVLIMVDIFLWNLWHTVSNVQGTDAQVWVGMFLLLVQFAALYWPLMRFVNALSKSR